MFKDLKLTRLDCEKDVPIGAGFWKILSFSCMWFGRNNSSLVEIDLVMDDNEFIPVVEIDLLSA